MITGLRYKATIFIIPIFLGCAEPEVELSNSFSNLETIMTLDNYPAKLGVYENYSGSPEDYDVEFYLRLIDHPEFTNLVLEETDTSLIKLLFYQSLHPSVGEEEADQTLKSILSANEDQSIDYEANLLFHFSNPFLDYEKYTEGMVFLVSGEVKKPSNGSYQNELNAHPFLATSIHKKSECEINAEKREGINDLARSKRYRLLGVNYQDEFHFPTCEENELFMLLSTDSAETNEGYYEDGKDWRFFDFSLGSCQKELYYYDEHSIFLKPYIIGCTLEDRPNTRDELTFENMVGQVFSEEVVDYHAEDDFLYFTNPGTGDQLVLFSEGS